MKYWQTAGLLLALFWATPASAIHFGAGASFYAQDVQSGEEADGEESTPPDWMILLGHRFRLYRQFRASPEIAYVFNKRASEDSYGGEYSIRSLVFHWHALYPLLTRGLRVDLRFGATQFIRFTKGDGGEVTVPNGSSTATAFRPEEKSTSYTAGPTLGFEVARDYSFSVFRDVSFVALLTVPQVFEGDKRTTVTHFYFTAGF